MENVKKFYDLAEKDEGLKTELIKVNERIKSKQSDFDGIKKLIEDEILPLAKKKGLGFTVDELMSFANQKYTELSEEELLEVSGGLSARSAAIGLSTVLLLSLGGTSAKDFLSYNDGLNPSISISAPVERQETQKQENENQTNEENDNEYPNELSTKEFKEKNTPNKAAQEGNAQTQQNEKSEQINQSPLNSDDKVIAGKIEEENMDQGEDVIFGRLQERFDKGRFDYEEDEEGSIFGGLQDQLDEERFSDEEDIEKMAPEEYIQSDKESEERKEDVKDESEPEHTNEQIFYEVQSNENFRATMVADIANYLRTIDGNIEKVPEEVREGLLKNVEFVRSYIRFDHGTWTIRQDNVEYKISSEDAEMIIDFDDNYNNMDSSIIRDESAVVDAVEKEDFEKEVIEETENKTKASEETQSNKETDAERPLVQEENEETVESEIGKEGAQKETQVDPEFATADEESIGEQEEADAESDQEILAEQTSADEETNVYVDNQGESKDTKGDKKAAAPEEESYREHEDASSAVGQETSAIEKEKTKIASNVSDNTQNLKIEDEEDEEDEESGFGGMKIFSVDDERVTYEGQSLLGDMKSRERLVIELADYLKGINGNLDNVKESDQEALKKDVKEVFGWMTEKKGKDGTAFYEVKKSALGKLVKWFTTPQIISEADYTIIKDFANAYCLESYEDKGDVKGRPGTNTERQEDAEAENIKIEVVESSFDTDDSTVETVETRAQGEDTDTEDASVQEDSVGTAEAEVEVAAPTVETAEKGVQGEDTQTEDASVQGDSVGTTEAEVAAPTVETAEKGVQGEDTQTKDASVQGDSVGTAEAEVASPMVETAEKGVQGEDIQTEDASVQGDSVGTTEAEVEVAAPMVETADANIQGDSTEVVDQETETNQETLVESQRVEKETITVEGDQNKEPEGEAGRVDQEVSGETQSVEEKTDASVDIQRVSEEVKGDGKAAATEGKSSRAHEAASPEGKQEADVSELTYEAPPRFLTEKMVKYVVNYLRRVEGNMGNVPAGDREKLKEDVEFLVKHFKSNKAVADGIKDINGNVIEISRNDRFAIFEFKITGRWNSPQRYGEYDATNASKDERDLQDVTKSAKVPYKVREQENSSTKWYDQEREVPIRIEAVRDYLEFISGDINYVENSDRETLLKEITDIFKYLKYNETTKSWQVLAPGRNNYFTPIGLKEDEVTSLKTFYEKYNEGPKGL